MVKRLPRAELALGGDAAAVQLDDLLREREPEAGAARLAGDEELEEVRQLLGRDAGPGVGDVDAQLSPSSARARADREAAAARHRLDGVRHQGQQHLLDLRVVELDLAAAPGRSR